jgi:hypothetical protein
MIRVPAASRSIRTRHLLAYTRPAPGVLQVDGTLDGEALSMRLRRMDDTTAMRWRRPFRWVTDPVPMGMRPPSPNARSRPAPPAGAQ